MGLVVVVFGLSLGCVFYLWVWVRGLGVFCLLLFFLFGLGALYFCFGFGGGLFLLGCGLFSLFCLWDYVATRLFLGF